MICKNQSSITDTPFGACNFLLPNSKCFHHIDGEKIEVNDCISFFKEIPLMDYINKKWDKWDKDNQNFEDDRLLLPIQKRLKIWKFDKTLSDFNDLLGISERMKLFIKRQLPK